MATIVLPKGKYELVVLLKNGRTRVVHEQHPGWQHTWKDQLLKAKGETVICECYCALLAD